MYHMRGDSHTSHFPSPDTRGANIQSCVTTRSPTVNHRRSDTPTPIPFFLQGMTVQLARYLQQSCELPFAQFYPFILSYIPQLLEALDSQLYFSSTSALYYPWHICISQSWALNILVPRDHISISHFIAIILVLYLPVPFPLTNGHIFDCKPNPI